ncbi:MAG: hypothetical protein GY699_11180 [Desulfobacteraceae bacterium]|nr:hypothetical protein [Desulfobacteraceae bacterium]
MKHSGVLAAVFFIVFLFLNTVHAIQPVADAGPDQVVFNSVIIDGSNSHDLDGTIISYNWTILNRFTTEVFFATGEAIISLDNMDPGLYEITLEVTNNQYDTHSDVALIGVSGSCGLESTCPGDFDNDGDVDNKDLIIFASKYGCNDCFDQDNDQDGFIALDDCNDMDPHIYPGAPEQCDNKDNDCDGEVDEDWPLKNQPCVVGTGACTAYGVFICNSNNPSGSETCSVTPNNPGQEICDGIDNDCDGEVDEDWPLKNQSCVVGTGACTGYGVFICNSNNPSGSETCSVTPNNPGQEICDGIDNDCDGEVDEDWPLKNQSCVVGTGACTAYGVFICNSNDPSGSETCSAVAKTPGEEICDSIDNDCDGEVDEGWVNPSTGFYDLDYACGNCLMDCTQIYDKPNAQGVCDPSGSYPVCSYVCEEGYLDLNNNPDDGCEFYDGPE